MITPDNSFFTKQWGLYLIKVPQAWVLLNKVTQSNPDPNIITENSDKATFGRSDVRVAIIDTGIETENNIPMSKSFQGDVKSIDNTQNLKLTKHIYTDKPNTFYFIDGITGGHGMNVAGISAAKVRINNVVTYNGNALVGVAPNCPVYSIANNIPDIITKNSERTAYFFDIIIGLAGIEEYSATPVSHSILNTIYNLTSDLIGPINRLLNGDGSGTWLNDILYNNYADIFNLSIGMTSTSQRIPNYSKIIFNETSFFGRGGRGCILVVAAGNAGVDMETSTGNFFGGFAYSNKPIAVGSISVNNNYDWLQGTPLPHPKKSDYSNFGNRIDVCAPGGGAKTPNGQEINQIYTTTVRGGGTLYETPIIEVNLEGKEKIEISNTDPLHLTYYFEVELKLKNTNGVFAGQIITFKIGTSINYQNLYTVNSVQGKKVKIRFVKIADYNSWSLSNTSVIFSPLYSKVTQITGSKSIKLESLKGIHKGAEIQVGNLGNAYSQENRNKLLKIQSIDYAANEITTNKNITSNVGDIVVLSTKTDINVVSVSETEVVLDTKDEKAFFIGGKLELLPLNNIALSTVEVKRIYNNGRQIIIDFEDKIDSDYLSTFGSDVKKARMVGFGDLTPSFDGTSAAAPFVSGIAALVLSANKSLSSAEVKHIIKQTTVKIDISSNPYTFNPDGYQHNINYGTGLVNAQSAVQLALDWHDPSKYGITVAKPIMAMADGIDVNNNPIYTIPINVNVNSPDIWVLPDSDTSGSTPTALQPLNTLDTSVDQKIYIRVRNLGNRQSFKECDVRVFVAFTDDVNPAFPFPDKWYHQEDVKLLGVKELPIISITDPISENNFTILEFEWKDIAAKWNNVNSWNPLDDVTGKRKRAYILAHIAPFDGLFEMDNSTNPPINLSLVNVRQNKQLTYKEIIVTHNGVSDRTAFLPGKKLDITVGQELVEKTFDLNLENIVTTDLEATKIKATKKNRIDQSEEHIFFSKDQNDNVWKIEGGLDPQWIKFETPDEIASQYDGYKHIKFPHTIIVNNSSEEIKIETLNA